MKKEKMSNKKFLTVWTPILGFMLVFLIVASILLSSTFYGVLTTFFEGGEKVIQGNGKVYYEAVAKSHDEAIANSKKLITEIQGEGTVLLKNDGCLPIASGSKLTLFGRDSVDILYGGGGSGQISDSAKPKTLKEALEADGFKVNDVMWNTLNAAKSKYPRGKEGVNNLQIIGEIEKSDYNTQNVKNSFASYGDYGVVVIGRSGAEGVDLPLDMKDWGGEAGKHFLELCNAEEDMVEYACENFKDIIVLINSSATLELGWLNDYPQIKAALYIGYPGETGLEAIGDILKGDITPSGHTVDTFAYDLTAAPSFVNMTSTGFGYNNLSDHWFVEYEEGIYVGYRYYETRGETDGEEWYQSQVQYPFGFGLSYTDFEWTVKEWKVGEKGGTISVRVEVENVGDKAGKDVVQLYYSAPYKPEESIEKSSVVLGGFAKTKLLEKKGDKDEVTITMNYDDMASYDMNTEKAYVLSSGEYTLSLRSDAHTVKNNLTHSFMVNDKIVYKDVARANDKKVATNLFDDVSGHIKKYLSRNDWTGTWPTAPTGNDFTASQEIIDGVKAFVYDTYKNDAMPTTGANNDIWLVDLIKYDKIDYNDPDWDKLLDKISKAELIKLVSQAGYKTQKVDSVGKPVTVDSDGPGGFASFFASSIYGAGFTSEVVLASSWNTELAERMGNSIGEEGIKGGYAGWYAPGMNTHRSPFGGRNFEYYSEDGVLAGKMGAAVIKGCQDKGVFCYVKHFALNDSETKRDKNGLLTWAGEQSMREIYFRPFEISVKEGQTRALMSSFNRLGSIWAGGCRPLLTDLLRGEWGFKGSVVTDYNSGAYMNTDQMLSVGGDLMMDTLGKKPADQTSAAAVAAMRAATKNILFTVGNSHAMNGATRAAAVTAMPAWYKVFIAIDVVAFVAVAAGAGWVVFRVLKNRKANSTEQAE